MLKPIKEDKRYHCEVNLYPGEIAETDAVPTYCCSAEKCYFVEYPDGYEGYFGVNDVEILDEVDS